MIRIQFVFLLLFFLYLSQIGCSERSSLVSDVVFIFQLFCVGYHSHTSVFQKKKKNQSNSYLETNENLLHKSLNHNKK